MGKVISFLNMKGGVGKTTLCINVAYCLVKHFNKKVLLIDMDPQFNATQSLMEKYYSSEKYLEFKKQKKTVLQVFQNDKSLIEINDESSIEPTDLIVNLKDNFDMVIGDLDLIKVESSERGTENLLIDFINRVNNVQDYEYILIDCPPTYSFFTTSSLIASDFYLAPIKPDVYSILGIDLLRHVVENVNRMHRVSVKPLGIIFTMIDSKLVRQSRIIEGIKQQPSSINVFSSTVEEFEYIASGKMDTFMLDMAKTNDEIKLITQEFIEEIESYGQNKK